VYLAQGVITNSVLSWSFISDLTLGLTHSKISSVTLTGRIRNTHFTLSLDWTYPQGMAKCCPPSSRELGMFPVHKMHTFHLINKQCIVMPGWYRTLIGGYLQPVEQILWPNAHNELGISFFEWCLLHIYIQWNPTFLFPWTIKTGAIFRDRLSVSNSTIHVRSLSRTDQVNRYGATVENWGDTMESLTEHKNFIWLLYQPHDTFNILRTNNCYCWK